MTGSDAGACTAAAPCASFNRAYQLAAPGSTVEVAEGTYPSQKIVPSTKPGTDRVRFRPVPGAKVLTGEVRIEGASRLEFEDMTMDDYYVADGSDDIVFRNVDARIFYLRSATRVSILGGRIGGTTHGVSATIGSSAKSDVPSRDITIDGVEFHDMSRVDRPEAHVQCLFIQSVDGLVLRNSRFRNCDIFDVYVNNILIGPVPTDVLIENNFFGTTTGGGFYSLFFRSDPGEVLTNVTVRHNSFAQGLHFGRGAYENVDVTANVGPLRQFACTPGVEYGFNVWSAARCGARDAVAAPGFRDPETLDLHLVRGAAALGRGDPENGPSRDIDGDLRPRGRPADAGADQRESAEIVVGRSVGGVRLGMARDAVRELFGAERRARDHRFTPSRPQIAVVGYRRHGARFSVVYDANLVVGIVAWSAYYRTAAGIGPGADPADARGFRVVRETRCGDVLRRRSPRVDTVLVPGRDGSRVDAVAVVRRTAGSYCGLLNA